jgi:hypothetical protein
MTGEPYSSDQESEIASLREMICENFPDEKVDSMHFPGDGEELDDARELYYTLRNLKWSEVPEAFIRSYPSELGLLRDVEFVAFLPAWLLQALKDAGKANPVREYMIYTFSPQHDLIPDMTSHMARRLKQMNRAQIATLRSVLKVLTKYEPSKFIREQATRAVAFIDHYETPK